jgi:hypothetical protein
MKEQDGKKEKEYNVKNNKKRQGEKRKEETSFKRISWKDRKRKRES